MEYRGCDTAAVPPSVPVRLLETGLSLKLVINLLRFVVERVTQGTLANFDFDQLVNPALEGLAGEDVQVIVKIGAIAVARRHSAQAFANTDALTTIAQFVRCRNCRKYRSQKRELMSTTLSDELVGALPTAPLMPVTGRERILSIDILRGFALLGILVSNIDIFAGPETFYEIPQGLPDTSFINSHLHLNLLILFSKWIFTEGKMRALFSMLFGVGLLLMTERSTQSGRAAQLQDIYLRRNLRLCVFGLLHGALIWLGDILLGYGLSGLVRLYRNSVSHSKADPSLRTRASLAPFLQER